MIKFTHRGSEYVINMSWGQVSPQKLMPVYIWVSPAAQPELVIVEWRREPTMEPAKMLPMTEIIRFIDAYLGG